MYQHWLKAASPALRLTSYHIPGPATVHEDPFDPLRQGRSSRLASLVPLGLSKTAVTGNTLLWRLSAGPR